MPVQVAIVKTIPVVPTDPWHAKESTTHIYYVETGQTISCDDLPSAEAKLSIQGFDRIHCDIGEHHRVAMFIRHT